MIGGEKKPVGFSKRCGDPSTKSASIAQGRQGTKQPIDSSLPKTDQINRSLTIKIGVLAVLQEGAGAEVDQLHFAAFHVDDHLNIKKLKSSSCCVLNNLSSVTQKDFL